MAAQIDASKGSQIDYAIDEKLCVFDAVFLLEFMEKRLGRISATMFRQSCMQHGFLVKVDRSVEPDRLLISELNLFFIKSTRIGSAVNPWSQ